VNFDGKNRHWQQAAGDYQLQLGHSATSFQGAGKVALTAATWAADASPAGTPQPCTAGAGH
jgi:beta-glucosidase